jgi:glycosyltransferase involved in cell wall biosynthesis
VIHTRRQTPKSSGIFLQNWFYTHYTQNIIAVSTGVKNELVKMGIPEEHVIVIRNGTPPEKYRFEEDPDRLENLRARYNIAPGDTVIGCVSRYKQQEQLLEALRYINRPLKVIFVGIHEKESYRRITGSYNDRHTVMYTGHVAPADVLYYYRLFRVKVLPSVTEGLSQALLESMAMGVPVVATAAAGNLDLIRDGVNGYLFKEGDTRELAAKIEALLDDPAMARKFTHQGKKTALHDFHIEHTIDQYESFFKQIFKKEEVELPQQEGRMTLRINESINESHA